MIYEKLAHIPAVRQSDIYDLHQFFHYSDVWTNSQTYRETKNIVRIFYTLRGVLMSESGKKRKWSKKGKQSTHWCSLDMRPKEVSKDFMDWFSDPEKFISALIMSGEEGATISVKKDDKGHSVAFLFLNLPEGDYDQLGIRAGGKDSHLALCALMYKYDVMLDDYELPDKVEEMPDFF